MADQINTEEERAKALADLNAILQFLYGEEELDGVWFGSHPEGKPPFWWRSKLRAALKGALLSASQPVAGQGWIPVSERLPEVNPCGEPGCPHCDAGACCDSVLAIFDPAPEGGSRFQTVATAYFHAPHFRGITHWMPLPAAPSALSQPSPLPVAGQAVAWQYRNYHRDDDPGWGLWHECSEQDAQRLRGRPDTEVRALFALSQPSAGTAGGAELPVKWNGADGTQHEISIDYAAQIAKWMFDKYGDVPQVDAVLASSPSTEEQRGGGDVEGKTNG